MVIKACAPPGPEYLNAMHTSMTHFAYAMIGITVLITLFYWLAAHGTKQSRHPWSRKRLIAFIIGSVLLLFAFSPPLLEWAHHDVRGHMVQHLLLGMFAPVAWVIAAPMTLFLRTAPLGVSRGCSRLLRSNFFHILAHPASAIMLNIGGMYLLYLTPLYLNSLNNLWWHVWMHLHFILAGYLYCWSIAGRDASPFRSSFKLRLFTLLLGLAAHSYLAKLMYINLWPAVPFNTADEIRTAAKIMYYGGDLAEALLAAALFYGWLEDRKKAGQSRRISILFPAKKHLT